MRAVDRRVRHGVDDDLRGAVRARRLDVHDGQPGPGRGQAPAVPPGDHLVQVVPDGGRRRARGSAPTAGGTRRRARRPARGRPPGSPVTVTRRRCRLCHARVTSSQTSTRMPRTRSSSSSSRVPSSAASCLGLLHAGPQLGRPVAAGQREPGRAQRAGGRRRRVAVGLARVLAGEVAGVLVELEAGRRRGRGRGRPSSSSPSGSGAAHPRVAGPRGEHRAADDHGGAPRREHLQVGGRRGERDAHPGRARRARRARRRRRAPSSTTSTARPSRRSSAGVEPNEPTRAWKSCSGRSGRGVGGASGSGSVRGVLLRLLGPLVVAPHRVGVAPSAAAAGSPTGPARPARRAAG